MRHPFHHPRDPVCLHHSTFIPEGRSMPKLVDCTNGRARGEFPVNKDRMVIGSKAANEVPLANLNDDKEHAVIIRCGDLYVIEDLGSATGTLVNERQVSKLLLSDGDLISVGNGLFRFIEEDPMRGRRRRRGRPGCRRPP
jgi:hypothetical protein